LENENQRLEYSNLTKEKQDELEELSALNEEYTIAINYANENKSAYEQLKDGRNNDELTKDKMQRLEDQFSKFSKAEKDYRQDVDLMTKDLETKVIFPKLADLLKTEIEVILNSKKNLETARGNILNDSQIDDVTKSIVHIIEEHYIEIGTIDIEKVAREFKKLQKDGTELEDSFSFLSIGDVEVLEKLVHASYENPFVALDEKREMLNSEISDMPQRKEQYEDYRKLLSGSDYSFIEKYETNSKRIEELKELIGKKKDSIKELDKKISRFDYDIPQVPDPQYDMLCILPDFFKNLSKKLLRAKKASIERMMRDQLNINLVVYAGVVGRVELSADDSDEISFKIYHKNGNEIYLSQLNAGAKQTVMQVLLKVLYNLGDYEPPVMIDTVMGVLDKESREVILEQYFPDLAHQTILLSTDTEITTERDFAKIQKYVSKTYTLHRDKEKQCTFVSDDYFGLLTNEN